MVNSGGVMRLVKQYNSEYARREIIRTLFKDMSRDHYVAAEHLIIELQQIVRDAARTERLRAMK